MAVFLSLWLCGWTVGCVVLVFVVWNDPKPLHWLFAAPFWAAWLFVMEMVLIHFYGRETVELTSKGVAWSRASPGYRQARFVPTAELRGVQEFFRKGSDDSAGSTVIELTTVGLPLRFGANLGQRERQWLMQQFERRIEEVRSQLGLTRESDDVETWHFRRRAADDEVLPNEIHRTVADPPQPRPSDSRYDMTEDFEGLEFAHHGRWDIETLGGIGFAALFWNSIVGVFIYVLIFGDADGDPKGAAAVGMGVFLIPFVAIGLLLMTCFAAALFAPWFRVRLRFARSEFANSWSWFGVGHSHAAPVASLDRIEVVLIKADEADRHFSPQRLAPNPLHGSDSFTLVLVDRESREVAKVERLTRGEALWMADVVLRSQREWFL